LRENELEQGTILQSELRMRGLGWFRGFGPPMGKP